MAHERKKRRKLSHDSYDSEHEESGNLTRDILKREIDLEIALRERVAKVIQARIEWALSLQRSLTATGPATPDVPREPDALKEAALDALRAIEEPCDLVFERTSVSAIDGEASPRQISNNQSLWTSAQSAPPAASVVPAKSRQLYIRISSSNSSFSLQTNGTATTGGYHLLKLACQTCSRTGFISLQGLLNHARLSHGVQYGSHDECIEACALLVNDEEQRNEILRWGIEVPLGEGGMSGVPSLRKLFERAVGIDGANAGLQTFEGWTRDMLTTSSQPRDGHATHLALTLGHHRDTPALAPFLGRAPKRQCIDAFDEDLDVDIISYTPSENKPIRRDPVAYLNSFDLGVDLSPATTPDASPHHNGEPLAMMAPPHSQTRSTLQQTRFHIHTRLAIIDQSLWNPPGMHTPQACGIY